jgi:hypothetical protein
MNAVYLPGGRNCPDYDKATASIDTSEWAVADLTELRRELKELKPCIDKIYSWIRSKRTSEDRPLRGIHSDILYVWCSMTIAANRAFALTGDAPMNYDYYDPDKESFKDFEPPYFGEYNGGSTIRLGADYEDDSDWEEDAQQREEELQRQRERIAAKWQRYYDNCIVTKTVNKFQGTTFVLSGMDNEDEIKKLIESKGGFCRKQISGKTDYLVVYPPGAGDSKYRDVLAQKEKGHTVKVIFANDFRKSAGLKPIEQQNSPYDEVQDSATPENTTEEIQGMLDDLNSQLASAKEGADKFIQLEKQRLEREENAEKERAQKRAEARNNRNPEHEKTLAYMAIRLEEWYNKLFQEETGGSTSDDDFFDNYSERFPALEKEELIALRHTVESEIQNPDKKNEYDARVKAIPFDERVDTMAQICMDGYPFDKINFADMEPHCDVAYMMDEYGWIEKSEHINAESRSWNILYTLTDSVKDKLREVNPEWGAFKTAKKYLHIALYDPDMKDFDPRNCFMADCGCAKASVILSTDGIFKISTNISHVVAYSLVLTEDENEFYDGDDIWNAAFENPIQDNRSDAGDGREKAIAETARYLAFTRMRIKIDKPAPIPEIHKPEPPTIEKSKPVQTEYRAPKFEEETPPEPAKKEGCYIATAVYGSYDAPEVMTLRKFRDNVLKKSVFGRMFIRFYYRLSPPLAEKLKYAKRVNRCVKRILDCWVRRLEKHE